jgi:hypothetical protein
LQRSPRLPEQVVLKTPAGKFLKKSQAAKEKAASRTRLNSIDFLRVWSWF